MSYHLSIDGLSVSLGDAERKFTLETGKWSVSPGEVIGFTGPSGTGKTLLLELLGLLRAPLAGQYDATPTDTALEPWAFSDLWQSGNASARAADARAQFFGFVPQAGGLVPYLTVSENIGLSQQITNRIDTAWQDHLIASLGLGPVARLRPGALSIGQRQRVAIARALAHRPYCVIADEPTAALDPENAETAMSLLIDAARQGGAATLLSSHDVRTMDKFIMRRMRLELTSSQGGKNVTSTLVEASAQPDGAGV